MEPREIVEKLLDLELVASTGHPNAIDDDRRTAKLVRERIPELAGLNDAEIVGIVFEAFNTIIFTAETIAESVLELRGGAEYIAALNKYDDIYIATALYQVPDTGEAHQTIYATKDWEKAKEEYNRMARSIEVEYHKIVEWLEEVGGNPDEEIIDYKLECLD